ncbi:MAG: hypothetical protein EON88_32040, partial [Brevundimonas sp.]
MSSRRERIGQSVVGQPALSAALDGEGRLILSGEILQRLTRVIFKTAQGLYSALYERFVPVNQLELICLQARQNCSLDDLVERVRPPQVLDITDEPLPEITPN